MVRQVEEAPHNADFHPSILQHIHELALVWTPNTTARALQHIVGVFKKPQERVSSMHTALPGALSVATVCHSTQSLAFVRPIQLQFSACMVTAHQHLDKLGAPPHKGFLKTKCKSPQYVQTCALGKQKLVTELVKFHCLEFLKAKPHCHAFIY